MNDALKIIIGGQIRQWILLLAGAALSHKLLSEETVQYIASTPAALWFTIALAVGAALRGLYVRLRSKTAQKIALDMRPGSSMEQLKEEVKNQPVGSILTAKPTTALLIAALIPCFMFASCETTGDPVLVNAQKVTTTSFDVFNAYVHLEYNNKDALKAQFGDGPHKLANEIRLHGRDWIRTSRALEDAYENSRTPENKANMTTAINVIAAALSQAQFYMGAKK